MFRSRSLIVLAGVAGLAGPAMAEEVGIGVSFFQDSGMVFVPISVTQNFRVEPYAGFYKTSRSSDSPMQSSSNSSSNSVLGTGLFATGRVLENVQLYGGGRVAYVRRKQSYASSSSSYPSQDTTTSTSGYLVAPTMGFEYFLLKNISIGAEVGISYTRTSGSENNSANEADTRESTSGTSTAMTIRYYWN
jgi:hypothetical protein